MIKNKIYAIALMVALFVSFLALCTILYPEKVIIGTDDFIWDRAIDITLILWIITLLSSEKKIFKDYSLTISVASVLGIVAMDQIIIPQVLLAVIVFAIAIMVHESDINMFIKKYNEQRRSSSDLFTTLTLISFVVFVIVFFITDYAIALAIIAVIILSVMTWDLV